MRTSMPLKKMWRICAALKNNFQQIRQLFQSVFCLTFPQATSYGGTIHSGCTGCLISGKSILHYQTFLRYNPKDLGCF